MSELKLVRIFLERPTGDLNVSKAGRFDFDEALLPEDRREGDLEEGELKVEEIVDVRSGRKTRYGRVHRQF